MVAGLARAQTFDTKVAATIRTSGHPRNSGWFDRLVPGTPTALPGSADTIRANYGDNTITLTTVAPNVARFQLGVDESGTLVVESGGSLTAIGASANTVGNNKPASLDD